MAERDGIQAVLNLDDGENAPAVVHAQHIFLENLQQEIRTANLEEPLSIVQAHAATAGYYVRRRPDNGELRVLLDRFSRSEERQMVRAKAEEVPINNLDYEGFSGLLNGLFQDDGITYERMLVLFCFCSDVCVRALRETTRYYFELITSYSLRFVSATVSTFVMAGNGVRAAARHRCCKLGMVAVGCLAILAIGATLRSK